MTEEVKEQADGLGASEHDQAMIDKSEETIEQAVQQKVEEKQASPTDRPDWLPEKYKSVDDFLEGHKNLEKKLGERDEIEPTEESEAEEESETEAEQGEAGPLDTFFEEYAEDGTISEDSFRALEDLGYPRDMVETYISGYEAKVAQITGEAQDIVGGKDNYDAMLDWAINNMSSEQLDAYNSQLASGGDNWEIALRGLHAKYVASGDAPVERIQSGGKGNVDGIAPFTSQQELTAATRDKRYTTSPEYRQMVMDRLAISDDATMGANIPNPYAAQG